MLLPTLWTWTTARLHIGERDERGANLVEYIILIAFIALLVIAAILFFKDEVKDEFSEAGNSLNNSGP